MPTAPISTFGAKRVEPIRAGDDVYMVNVNLKASTTFVAGTLLGEITASPGTYGTYASGNSDGTQNPTGHVLEYPAVTDASGNITLTGEWGQTQKSVPVWVSGEFNCADLPNLDTNAAGKIGRLTEGTVSAGTIVITGP